VWVPTSSSTTVSASLPVTRPRSIMASRMTVALGRIDDQECSDLFVELKIRHLIPSNPDGETAILAQLKVHGHYLPAGRRDPRPSKTLDFRRLPACLRRNRTRGNFKPSAKLPLAIRWHGDERTVASVFTRSFPDTAARTPGHRAAKQDRDRAAPKLRL